MLEIAGVSVEKARLLTFHTFQFLRPATVVPAGALESTHAIP